MITLGKVQPLLTGRWLEADREQNVTLHKREMFCGAVLVFRQSGFVRMTHPLFQKAVTSQDKGRESPQFARSRPHREQLSQMNSVGASVCSVALKIKNCSIEDGAFPAAELRGVGWNKSSCD